ncbi:MAG: glycosyltransferase [Lachnospiraceae bacterium]|nr:glycosyltransferase [Lachnospiraceae bacterium]
MGNVVLFGCGAYVEKFISILNYIQIKVIAITDNEKNKIGESIGGIPVIAPRDVCFLDCTIVISCPYITEITEQLDRMGIKSRVKGLRELILESCCDYKPILNEKRTIGIDLLSKARWGGAETWSYQIAQALNDGECVLALASSNIILPLDLSVQIIRFCKEDLINDMIQILKKHLPLVYINNFSGNVHSAVLILKTLFPDDVQIIDIVHNDFKTTYGRHDLFRDFTDVFICVSSKIKKTMVDEYLLPAEKVLYAGQPISFDSSYSKKEKKQTEYIRIGYASRLEKDQKRANLLVTFINALENTNVNYILDVAGDGECFDELFNYIEDNCLSSKVRLLGYVDGENMKQFWKEQDIYISFSAFEGCSLSMLEAMSYGCVPVVTDVSGVKDHILSGYNGYICDVNNMETFAQVIEELFLDRQSMIEKGKRCQDTVLKKCGIEQYINILKGVFSDFDKYQHYNTV